MDLAKSSNGPTMWTKKVNGTDGHASDSSTENEPIVRMRVGEMYQAKVPTWPKDPAPKQIHSKEGMLIWSPNDQLPEEKLESYCDVAKAKHQYNLEQALGMLFWHKHDIGKSLKDMQNFTPMPDDWSIEDKVLFEQAYNFHGKNFRKIQQLVPDKEIAQLVKHYYTWKKSRIKSSFMDKQATKRRHEKNGNDSDNSQHGEVIQEEEDQKAPPEKMRITEDHIEIKHKLPKEIQLSMEDITTLSEHVKGPEGFLNGMDDDLVTIKRQVQFEKQESGKLISSLNSIKQPPSIPTPVKTQEWTERELEIAVKAVQKFGRNYKVIAGILETKSVEAVKEFFTTYNSKYNLDQIVQEYENNSTVKIVDDPS